MSGTYAHYMRPAHRSRLDLGSFLSACMHSAGFCAARNRFWCGQAPRGARLISCLSPSAHFSHHPGNRSGTPGDLHKKFWQSRSETSRMEPSAASTTLYGKSDLGNEIKWGCEPMIRYITRPCLAFVKIPPDRVSILRVACVLVFKLG